VSAEFASQVFDKMTPARNIASEERIKMDSFIALSLLTDSPERGQNVILFSTSIPLRNKEEIGA
jgi:hypothetical protein